jgi:gentisate 1,2-dioxygenase
MSRSLALRFVLVLAGVAMAAAVVLETGLARRLFHEVYERLAGVEVLGPAAVRVTPADSPYQRWLQRARAEIPVYEGWTIPDVRNVELRPWPQMGEGVHGLYLSLTDDHVSDARILEIPPGGSTSPQRQLYEMGIYFIDGPGHTALQQQSEEAQRVEWRAGGLLAVPLNVRHQHFNDSAEPIRLLVVTSFPFVLNAFNSESFIESNYFAFTDRYDASGNHFDRNHHPAPDWLTTSFVPDILDSELSDMAVRGAGNQVMHWTMAGNSMLSLHVSEIPPRSYKKAHRHSNGSIFLLLSGEGFSLTWPAAAWSERRRVDWKPGTLFAPPPYWYHQHLNPGQVPARYLSINTPDLLLNLGLRFTDQLEVPLDEVKREWAEELEKQSHGQR